MAREDLPWLVKSSGRILGPFPQGKIIELLRTREISVLDEVSEPGRRWQTIQYHDDFRAAIDSLRKASLSERTEATWTPSTVTGNLTQTVTDLADSDLTDELTASIDGFTGTPREIVVHNVQEQTQTSGPASTARFQSPQNQNTAIQRQVEKTARGLWIVTVIILLGVAAFILQRRLSHTGMEPKNTLSSLKQSVVSDIRAGAYTDALRELKAFYPDPTRAGEMAIYFGSLLIQVEEGTTVGRRLLLSVLNSHRPEQKEAFTSLGIADMIDGNPDSAQSYFDKALNIEPSYVPAMVNSAFVAILRGDYSRAKKVAMDVLRVAPSQGEAVLILAEAQLYLYKSDSNAVELARAHHVIRDYLNKYWDYAAEIGFYSLYFDFLRGDHSLDEKVRDYLDRDPDLTADHRHNVFIYHGRSQWKVLARLCEQMVEKMGESARVTAFLSACYAHETHWEQARHNIEKAVQQSPKDALVQGWFSYILKESGDGNQASVVLGNAMQLNRKGEYLLPIHLQAKFCEASDEVECARDNWQRIYERDLDNLPALAGLAWVNVQKNSRNEALKYIKKGFEVSPQYVPLLQLRQRGEKEGWYAGD